MRMPAKPARLAAIITVVCSVCATVALPGSALAAPSGSGDSSDSSLQHISLTNQRGDPQGPLRLTGGGARQGFTTDEISTSRFRFMELTWPHSDDRHPGLRVDARFHHDGTWSPWQTGTPGADDLAGTDGKAGARDGTSPMDSSGADGVQLRITDDRGNLPPDLRLGLVDVHVTAADRAAADSRRQSSEGSRQGDPSQEQRTFIPMDVKTRADWHADEHMADPGYKPTDTVKVAFVHHTVLGNNDYTREEVPSLMRAIYVLCVRDRGFGDFPYHFVVDRFGTVWEGRRGSIEADPHNTGDIPKAILGAHAGGFNTDTLGVAALGNFQPNNCEGGKCTGPNPQPTREMMNGLEAVLAWKLNTYGVDPWGASYLTSGGGPDARYPKGKTVLFENIAGHRDADKTLCPGQKLYDRLNEIRRGVYAILNPLVPVGG